MNDYTQSNKSVNSPDNLLVNNDSKPNETTQKGSVQGRTLQTLTTTDSDPINPIEVTANKTTNIFEGSNEPFSLPQTSLSDHVRSPSPHSYAYSEGLNQYTGQIKSIGENTLGTQATNINQITQITKPSQVNKRRINPQEEEVNEFESQKKILKTDSKKEDVQITSLAEQIAPNTTTSETLENLCVRVAQNLKISNEDLQRLISAKGNLNTANLLAVYNECINARFREDVPITKQEIKDLHSILFSPLLADLSEQQAASPIDVIKPAPAFVCKSLLNCLESIEKEGGYTSSIEEVKKFSLSKPKLEASVEILTNIKDPQKLQETLDDLKNNYGERGIEIINAYEKYLVDNAQYQTQLPTFPILESSHLFGGGNVNEVYTLMNEGKPQWVFKPANNANYDNHNIHLNEQMASRINYQNQFQVPLTVLIDLGDGEVGSAQLFVPECVKYGELQKDKHKLIDPKDLQKTVIFDLIAGNTDRHDGNLLCQKVGETYRLFAIDHDQCFQEPSIKGKSLSFCYENLDVLRQQEFLPEIADLISEEAEKIYEQKMKSASMDEDQIMEEDQYVDMGYGSGYGFGGQEMDSSHKIEWMKLVLAKTRKAVKEGETPADLIKNVAKAWENKLNGVVDDGDDEDDYY